MLNLFGNNKKVTAKEIVSEVLSSFLENSEISLSFNLEQKKQELRVDIFGEDEGLLKMRKGKLLLALQVYLGQILHKEFPEEKIRLFLDSNGFWKEQEERLMSLTETLIERALKKNKPITFKQLLSPNQRRLIHQRVSGNTGVRSQSFGSGVYKSLKLIPDTFTNDN